MRIRCGGDDRCTRSGFRGQNGLSHAAGGGLDNRVTAQKSQARGEGYLRPIGHVIATDVFYRGLDIRGLTIKTDSKRICHHVNVERGADGEDHLN